MLQAETAVERPTLHPAGWSAPGRRSRRSAKLLGSAFKEDLLNRGQAAHVGGRVAVDEEKVGSQSRTERAELGLATGGAGGGAGGGVNHVEG